jgi:hypothetical protein
MINFVSRVLRLDTEPIHDMLNLRLSGGSAVAVHIPCCFTESTGFGFEAAPTRLSYPRTGNQVNT